MDYQSTLSPLLRVEDLHVSFPSKQGVTDAVKSLSFAVNAGEILALVGESGSGKSVTARTLVGLPGTGLRFRLMPSNCCVMTVALMIYSPATAKPGSVYEGGR
jgi:ABC-type microcin C transport system duplicated ATPase subunit YejF